MEHCHSAAVSAWRVCRNDGIPIRPVVVDAVSELCFLEDAQVHVGLGHLPQYRLQSPVTTVTDSVGAEPNRHRPPRKPPSTPTHHLPTDSFLTLAPAILPVRAFLPFRRSRTCSAPVGLPLPFLSPLPSPFYPLSYSMPFTLA